MYAHFLDKSRGDKDGSEAVYKRAIEIDPQKSGDYAIFLDRSRKNKDEAEIFYRQSISANPGSLMNYINFGQFLAGQGRLEESAKTLHLALKHSKIFSSAEAAEVYFSLWLVTRMMSQDSHVWESAFKYYIQNDFIRTPWDFDEMLNKAEGFLSIDEISYAKALANAFLDSEKVADLEKFDRWRELKPQAPARIPNESVSSI